MDLVDVINRIIQENTTAQKLTDIAIGTVTKKSPLAVQINANMPPLPSAVLLLTDAVKERTETVYNSKKEEIGTVKVNSGLEVGDKVMMLRVLKGQQYIILSKIGE